MYRGRPWTMRQYAGFGTAESTNQRFKFLLARRPDRAVVRVRPADADGLRLRPPARRGRGRQGRRGDRLDRRHAPAARRHPARPGHDVDDDQLDGVDPAAALRARRRGAGRRRRSDLAARSRTTCSRSTSPAAPTSTRRGRRCGSSPTSSRTAPKNIPKWNTISISGYHIREAGSTAVQEIAFTLANGIAYVQAAIDAGLDVDDFAPAAVVLLERAQQLLRGGRQVPGQPADVAPDHDRALRRQGPRSRSCCASTPRPAGRRSPRSSR